MNITKKKVLIMSLCGTLLFGVLIFLSTATCYNSSWCASIRGTLSSDTLAIVLLFPPAFLLSLATYFLHEKVFRAWLHFASWWVPLSVFFILITSKGGVGFVDGLGWEKGK